MAFIVGVHGRSIRKLRAVVTTPLVDKANNSKLNIHMEIIIQSTPERGDRPAELFQTDTLATPIIGDDICDPHFQWVKPGVAGVSISGDAWNRGPVALPQVSSSRDGNFETNQTFDANENHVLGLACSTPHLRWVVYIY